SPMGIVLSRLTPVARKHHQHWSRYRSNGCCGQSADWWSRFGLLRDLRCHLSTFASFHPLQNILSGPQMPHAVSFCLRRHSLCHTHILDGSSARNLPSDPFVRSGVYGSPDRCFGNHHKSIPILLAVWGRG